MANNENNNQLPSSNEDAVTEINLGDFLNDGETKADDGKNLVSELENLYEDIVGDGSDTIVPKPMSVITQPENEQAQSLSDLWMSPEEYFDADIPVVSLDGEDDAEPEESVPSEAYFVPEASQEAPADEDTSKNDIFNMINDLKSEADSEDGFISILSEIEANEGIATVSDDIFEASQLVTKPEQYAETVFLENTEAPQTKTEDVISFDEKEPEQQIEINEFEIKEDYEDELNRILRDDNFVLKTEKEEQPKENKNFVIDIPDSGDEAVPVEAPPMQVNQPPMQMNQPPMQMNQPPVQNIYAPGQQNSSITYFTQEEFEKKMAQQKKAVPEKEPKKKTSVTGLIAKIVLPISIIVIIVCSGVLLNSLVIEPLRYPQTEEENADKYQQGIDTYGATEVVNEQLKKDFPDVTFPEGMLAKYAGIYSENDDLRGWVSIKGLEISLPVVQGEDNDYYLRRDVRGKYTTYGVPFFDYRMKDFRNLHMNNIIYGHNMRSDDYIFGLLENYRKIENYNSETAVIECNTIYGDYNWFVYAVFITNSDPADDNGYYFPYNFIDVSKEQFEGYIQEIDKRKFYTTGVDINSNDKILTLSTCCYDFDEARLVVVARLQREGESLAVDTSRAFKNANPKYPQAWYDEQGKTNTYADDARWDPSAQPKQ